MRFRLKTLVVMAGMLLAFPAMAKVTSVDQASFEIEISLEIKADADHVYAVLVDPEKWWSKDHSWTGQASNLYMTPQPGGCFCERLPNQGFAEHMRVIKVVPGQQLILAGGLGPLQALAVSGIMQWQLTQKDKAITDLVFTYRVSGSASNGLDGWADAVDGVLQDAASRLQQAAEIQP